MNSTPAIKLENVTKYYHRGSETVHAVENISLEIGQGEYVAVVGHSGSGKTTLMNLMGCLDRPSKGHIRVAGKDVSHANEAGLSELRKRTIGFVFQQFFLIPTLTVLHNVELPSLFAHTNSTDRARELLDRVGLGRRLDHLPGQLSGGEMQRVAIARSLINSPSILLADEPTGNLDSRNAATIMEIFEKLNAQGVTLVVVTHNHDLVKHSSRMVQIEDGRIQF